MNRMVLLTLFAAFVCSATSLAQDPVGVWMKYEKQFESDKDYENPLYDVKEFAVRFTSPSGSIPWRMITSVQRYRMRAG